MVIRHEKILAFDSIFFLSKFVLFASLLTNFLSAQNFSVKVPEKVGLKQKLIVSIEVLNSDATPEFISSDFTSLGRVGYSSSIQVINMGQPQKKANHQYALNPQKLGLGVFRVKVGSVLKGPFEVQVVEEDTPPPTQSQGGLDVNAIFGGRRSSSFTDDEAFVKNDIAKKTYYLNEPIEVIRRVYHRVNISGVQMMKREQFSGFGIEPNKDYNNQPRSVNRNGHSYRASSVDSFVLFPHLAGESILKGGVIRLQKQGGFFGGTSRDFKIADQKVLIKNFPAEGKPADFTRAVGNFTLSVKADKRTVKTHEPITLTMTISGRGNFNSIIPPTIAIADNNIAVKQSQISKNFSIKGGAHEGEKRIEYYIIPSKGGQFSFPETFFSFFNPKTKTYKRLSSPPISFRVLDRKKGEEKSTADLFSSLDSEKVELLKKDIRYIKTKNKPNRSDIIFSLAFSLFSLSSVIVIFTVFYYLMQRELWIFKHRQKKSQLNQVKNSLKGLEKLETDKDFFVQLEQLIMNHLSRQFDISPGESTANIKRKFKEDKSKFPIISSLMEVVTICQSYQFAPKEVTQDKEDLVKSTWLRFEDLEKLSRGKEVL